MASKELCSAPMHSRMNSRAQQARLLTKATTGIRPLAVVAAAPMARKETPKAGMRIPKIPLN